MTPTISIVIPTYKRTALLQRCLDAVTTQDFDPRAYEILVVDDARSDDSRAFVEAFARCFPDGPTVRYLRPAEGARGPAAARNAGWRAAQAEVIAFTDDDTIPARDWLSEGLRAMRPGVAAAWGDVIVPLPDVPTDWERNTAGLDGAEFVTANCFVRREAVAAVGGFDERFERPWREDSDLYFSLLEHGCQVVCAPAAIVLHPARQAPLGSSLKQHRNLFFDALLYKKHPDLYREKIAAAPPLRYYAAVVALLLAVAAPAAGLMPLAFGAAGIWLGLTAQLALHRLHGTSRAWKHVADVVLTSFAIPPLAVYWRLKGALHFRVLFA